MPFLKQNTTELLDSVRRHIDECSLAKAEDLLRCLIVEEPLNPEAFKLLSKTFFLLGKVKQAKAAEYRFMQLVQIAANAKPSRAAEQYLAVVSNAENNADIIKLEGFSFAGLRLSENRGQICLVGCSLDGGAFAKIEIRPPGRPLRRLRDETEIFRAFAGRGFVSCPRLIGSGSINSGEIGRNAWYLGRLQEMGIEVTRDTCDYVVLEYARADRGGFGLADIVLALLEQQALGLYQNCLALECIRFDSLLGICRLTDYREAILLDESQRLMGPRSYIQWCREKERSRAGKGGVASFFEGRDVEFDKLFRGENFLLARSRLFGRQRIADMPNPCIQDVNEGLFELKGTSSSVNQISILNRLSFLKAERVLDLGCGAGDLSRYFSRKGCKVTAIDVDPQMVEQCRLLANLSGVEVKAECCDLERCFPEGNHGTVLALGLFPHIENRGQLAECIKTTGCRRLILECAASETGYRWQGSEYHKIAQAWHFETRQELECYLNGLFPGYTLNNLGHTAPDRWLFLLEKHSLST